MRPELVAALTLAVANGLAPSALADETGGKGMMMGSAMPGMRLMMPEFDPANGRRLFAEKGCVTCHSVNGVGGEDAPALDWDTMDTVMNPFDFAARMWRGAPAMIAAQEDELGAQIEFTGQELADIIAFIHSPEEQARFSEADIPGEIREKMEHME